MNRQIAHNVTTTLVAIDKLGGKVAPAARKTLDAALADVRRVETWRPEGGNISDTVAAALAAGKDPASDDAVLRAIVGERVFEAREAVTETASQNLAAVVREHLDHLVDAFRKPYREAGARLTEARNVLAARGIGCSTEPSIILGAGPEAAAAWLDATAALATLNKIQSQLGSLFTVLGVSLAEPSLAWFDPNGLDLYDISTCTQPVLRSRVDFGEAMPHEFFLWRDPSSQRQGRTLLFVTMWGHVPNPRVIDIRDPTQPCATGAIWLSARSRPAPGGGSGGGGRWRR